MTAFIYILCPHAGTGGSISAGQLICRIASEWQNADDFKNTFHVDDWHQKIATAEMLDHKFLTDDYKVEQTTFSSGHAITVNFSSEPAQIEGKTIPPHDYIIKT